MCPTVMLSVKCIQFILFFGSFIYKLQNQTRKMKYSETTTSGLLQILISDWLSYSLSIADRPTVATDTVGFRPLFMDKSCSLSNS